MNLSNQQLRALLSQLNACEGALDWLGQRDLAKAWAECPRADWLLWLVGHMAGRAGWPTRAQVVIAACECVEPALRRVPAGEERPRRAIEAARAWADGKIGEDVVETAMHEIDDALAVSRWLLATHATRAAWYAVRAVFIPSEAACAAWYAALVAQTPSKAISAMAEVVRRKVQLPGGETSMNTTLIEILSGGLAYDDSWAVYAERIDGEFRPESRARIGQRRFENGGVEDDLVFFTNNKHAMVFIDLSLEELDSEEIDETDRREAALELIEHMNDLAGD
jgi:hypothetical protein